MSAPVLVLEASRDDRRVKVSVYERSGGVDGTLRPYEELIVPWHQVESGVSEFTNLLNRADKLGKISSGNFQSLKKSGQLLFDLLVPPKAAEKLNSSTLTSLVVYIDDKLVHIPWELLFNGREFLCRRFAMGRLVSTSQVPTATSKRTLKIPLKVLLIADPRQDLKASYREGLEIRDLLDRQQNDFEVDFKSAPVDIAYVKKNLRDYDIVHYAGHADYDARNPSDGGWLLSDGRLQASEISAMGGLQAMPFLVFSNACQSGQSGEWRVQAGYGQQIFGLANAYLMAGVQHYIGTFWEILDEPSSNFAKRFFSHLAHGEAVGEAVRKAREGLIEDLGEETVVWASYMLYGDPTVNFVASQKGTTADTVSRAIAPAEWSDAMRSKSAVAAANSNNRRPLISYIMISVLLAALGVVGYYLVSNSSTFVKITSMSSPTQTATSSSATPTEQLTKTPVVIDSFESKTEVIEAKATRVQGTSPIRKEVILPDSRLSIVATKEAVAVPVTKEVPPVIETKPAAVQTTDIAPVNVAAPLSLSMNVIGQRKEADGSYSEVLVSEGSLLRSRDNFQVHLEVNRPSYAYVLIYDSHGRAEQLFPDAKIDHPEFIQPGRKVVIPRRDLWFWLDDQVGTETIYVLASEKPMADIRGLLTKMTAVDDSGKKNASQEIKRQITIMQRGVGGISKGQAVTYTLSDGKKIQKVTDVVTGSGAVVRAVSFQHK